MRRVGLVLGGGGLVGIAWELGVMAGLQERAGFDPLAMTMIVGTSAGSVAGTRVALGQELGGLVERLRQTGSQPGPGQGATPSPSPPPPPTSEPQTSGDQPSIGTTVVPMEIMRLMVSGHGSMQERAAAIGKLAVDAEVSLSETDYVESFRRPLGTDVWPEIDLRLSTAECDSGRSVLWTKHDGIDLVRAVASSCAIPGYFPTVEFAGRRYMDGPRGGFYGDLVAEKALDALLFIGSLGALPPKLRFDADIDVLAEGGLPVVKVTGGDSLATVAAELMDPGARARAADVGVEDGRTAAAEVAVLLG